MRNGLRNLRRHPGYAAVAVILLALAIGINTAVFSLAEAALLRPIPVPQAGELYALAHGAGPRPDPRFSYQNWQHISAAFAARASALAQTPPATFYAAAGGDSPTAVLGQLVSDNYFAALQVSAPAVAGESAVLSHRYWRRMTGAGPSAALPRVPLMLHGQGSVLGQSITVNGVPLTIAGVAPAGFFGLDKSQAPDLWMPLELQPQLQYFANAHLGVPISALHQNQPWTAEPGIAWLQIVARVPRSTPPAALAGAASAVFARDLAALPGSAGAAPETVRLQSAALGLDNLGASLAEPLLWLLLASGLVLAIAGANLALLLLARNESRQQELAIRMALGASRRRLSGTLLGESLTLALIGGGLGLALAGNARPVLLRLLGTPGSAEGPLGAGGGDWTVAGFTLLLALATGALVALAPAWRLRRMEAGATLKAGTPHGAGRSGGWGRALIAVQMALSLVLLVGAGLLTRSLNHLLRLDPGFERQGVLTITMDPRAAHYDRTQLPALYEILRTRLQALPGVASASISQCGIQGGCIRTGTVSVPSEPGAPRTVAAQSDLVDQDFLSTLGIRLLRGRGFHTSDGPEQPPVAIVNETFARDYLDGADPVGAHFGPDSSHANEYRIVGVAADARVNNLQTPAPPLIWYPLGQNPDFARSLDLRSLPGVSPDTLVASVRQAIAAAAPGMPVQTVESMEQRLEATLGPQPLISELSEGFALLAAALAALGLYGTLSYSVARRTSEFGVRMALGAPPARLLRLVFGETLILAGIGIAAGLGLAWPGTRLLHSMLFGLTPHDPFTWVAASGLLLAVALAATAIPARRAARVDPMAALRAE